MRFTNIALAAGAAATVSAQRPEDTPICDYYTTALLKENTAENQATLLTLLVNTVVIGNYTQPNVGFAAGILAPGKVNDTDVNLAPYFTGALASSNRGGDKGVSVNSLDGGGAEPLMKNMPANDKTSNQYFLLTHLYEFFGSLLGCSMQGMTGFEAYTAKASMYEVHKFMDLSYAENTYFIQQVGAAAASFGVAEDDITAVAGALSSIFNVRCGPPTTAVKDQGDQLQSICIDEETCPLAEGAVCDQYDDAVAPTSVPASAMPTGTASGTMMPTGTETAAPTGTETTAPTSVPTGAASANGLSVAAVVAGLAAFIL